MGGPPPADELHNRRSPGGEDDTCTATGPVLQGQIYRCPDDGEPAFERAGAHVGEFALLAPDAPETGPVEKEDTA